jgi:hypothetical protein
MLIDGEKWACEACVRGHRVSNCQHADRPLQHINKKGRPVSQCHHCRSMRKSRSSHVKCDCGEKTHKCAHLQPTIDGHKDSCCCNHGGRCTCSHKKELSLDTVPESASDQECRVPRPKIPSRRRRAHTTHSEPTLSFDEHGHHRPTHKHNRAAQKCGPYLLSRGSSMHSTSSAGSLENRSVDSALYSKSGPTSVTTASSESSDPADSDQASPGSTKQQLSNLLPPLDLSSIRYPEYTPPFDLFSALSDQEPPMFSAGISATPVDWAQYDGLDIKGDNFAPSSFDPAGSYIGFDPTGSTEPTLTSTSGDVSENEEFASALGDSHLDGFRNSAASSYLSMSQGQAAMFAASDLGNLEFDQFKGAATKFSADQSSSLEDGAPAFPIVDDDAYWNMNNFDDGITQSPDPVASGLWDTL